MVKCMGEAAQRTILLVEDEAIIAMAEAGMLKKNGYVVQTAYSGSTAVEAVRSDGVIDLVLMDLDLGSGIDGAEAAELILLAKNLPVLFLSSHTEPEVVERTERIASYGYVVKNSGETVLLASIKMAFRLFEARIKYQAKAAELEAANAAQRATIESRERIEKALREREAEFPRSFRRRARGHRNAGESSLQEGQRGHARDFRVCRGRDARQDYPSAILRRRGVRPCRE